MLFIAPKWKALFQNIPSGNLAETETIDFRINSDIHILFYSSQDNLEIFKKRVKKVVTMTLLCVHTNNRAIYDELQLTCTVQISPMLSTEQKVVQFISHLNQMSSIQPILPITQHDMKLKHSLSLISQHKWTSLIQRFGNLRGICHATREDLAQVVSIPEADKVYLFLH